MKTEFIYQNKTWQIDFAKGEYIGIPLSPNSGPLFYSNRPVNSATLVSSGFKGSVRAGGSCNVESICVTPHCNGTHTEGSGHISSAATPVQDLIDPAPCSALLISLETTPAESSNEHYNHPLPVDYPLISRKSLQAKYTELAVATELHKALIIRSLPNPKSRQTRNYNKQPVYPLLSTEALEWLSQKNLHHLLIDTPSLDFSADNGQLLNHRIWWGMQTGSSGQDKAITRSITEMIYVKNTIKDGYYWLEINLSTLRSDACLSNPRIYPLKASG